MRSITVTMICGAAALVTMGCGGSEDGAAPDPPAGTSSEAPADTPAGGSSDAPIFSPVTGPTDVSASVPATGQSDGVIGTAPSVQDDDTPVGASSAIIEVGDETFRFEWTPDAIQRCDPEFFGGFWAAAATTSDQPSFEAELFPEGTAGAEDNTPKIEVDAGDGLGSWTADPDETIGSTYESWPAQVDSFEIDGNVATGTATFVGDVGPDEQPVGVPGTFEITCGG